MELKKIYLKNGLTQDTKHKQDKLVELGQVVSDVMHANGYPIVTGCCNLSDIADGSSLFWDKANGKWTAGTGASTVTNLTYTPSANNGLVSNSNGSGFVILAATGTDAGLLSPSQFTKLAGITGTASGTNTGDVTVTNSSSIDFTLTGQNITGVIKGISSAPVGSILSTDGSGNIVYVTLASKEKIDYLVPTAINTVPNLGFAPADPTKVKFYIDGLLTRGLTSTAAGVVTVNSAIIGHNIELDCEITAIYFVP